jgi:hypothetical protein
MNFEDKVKIFVPVWSGLMVIFFFWYIACHDHRPAKCRGELSPIICIRAYNGPKGVDIIGEESGKQVSFTISESWRYSDKKRVAKSIESGDTLVKSRGLCQWEVHKPDTVLVFEF